jgi:hypothetical protein
LLLLSLLSTLILLLVLTSGVLLHITLDNALLSIAYFPLLPSLELLAFYVFIDGH